MRYILIIPALLALISCNSNSSLKSYGTITTEIGEAASIDTSCNKVEPTILLFKSYTLSNKSKDQNIRFVCKAFITYYDKTFERSEVHILSPQKSTLLEIDSNLHSNLVKYEIVSAGVPSN